MAFTDNGSAITVGKVTGANATPQIQGDQQQSQAWTDYKTQLQQPQSECRVPAVDCIQMLLSRS